MRTLPACTVIILYVHLDEFSLNYIYIRDLKNISLQGIIAL